MRAGYIDALFDYQAYLIGKLAVRATHDRHLEAGETAEMSCAAQQNQLQKIQELIAAEKGTSPAPKTAAPVRKP